MRAAASPHARLRRALDRGDLNLAELAAKECPHIDLEDSLEICVLMRADRDERFERAAVRWFGRLLPSDRRSASTWPVRQRAG
jgi:hypothetical protein